MLDVSFADDLDNSLKNRTWGVTPEGVIANAGAFNRTMREQGILSCGKHFPGYSRAAVDPHHELPVVARSRQELQDDEWKAFQALGPEIDSMMVGHANYPALDDSGYPSSLSAKIIKGILREEWGYKGTVISDDLDMGAIVGHYGLARNRGHPRGRGRQRSRPALPSPRADSRGRQGAGKYFPRPRRWSFEKSILQLPRETRSTACFFRGGACRVPDKKIYQLRVDTLGAEAAAQRSIDDGKRSPVETF